MGGSRFPPIPFANHQKRIYWAYESEGDVQKGTMAQYLRAKIKAIYGRYVGVSGGVGSVYFWVHRSTSRNR